MHRPSLPLHSTALRFKRWSRKGYAAFVSLHRQVSIGALSVEISDRIGSKSKTQTAFGDFLRTATATSGTGLPDDGGGGNSTCLAVETLLGSLSAVLFGSVRAERTFARTSILLVCVALFGAMFFLFSLSFRYMLVPCWGKLFL